jgi:SAM-dependent methyltransferase
VADLPVALSDGLGERLSRVLDVEGKIPRALEALGPVAGRDVLLVDAADGLRARQLRELGARVTEAPGVIDQAFADRSADVVVGFWSPFRAAPPAELAAAERVLRPGGRLLVVHDYGRDDVSHLHGERPEYGAWSKRNGPFLGNGFRVRVIHCFWTFESMDDCREFLDAAFGALGRAVAADLKRPRLSYNVAVYHRTFGHEAGSGAGETEVGVAPSNPVSATDDDTSQPVRATG